MTTFLMFLNAIAVFVGLSAGIYLCCAHIWNLFNTDETKYFIHVLINEKTRENAKELLKKGAEIFCK